MGLLEIYKFLIEKVIKKNGSLIPSRNEKRIENIKWKVTWNNLKIGKRLTPEEKEFGWKVTQDMVAVGIRIHRNVDKRCLRKLKNGMECQVIPNLVHVLGECEGSEDIFYAIKGIVEDMLEKKIKEQELICLDITHRKRKRIILIVWFVIKSLYLLYTNKFFNKEQVLYELRKELDWNIKNMKLVGGLDDMQILRQKLES